MSITTIIIIINVLVSLAAMNNGRLMDQLIFYPPAITHDKQYYRFFTSGFIHADYAHLIFNMISLYAFGGMVESGFNQIFGESGRLLYLLMYMLALPASLIPTFAKNRTNSYYRSLGASGAVSAVIFAGLLMTPQAGVGMYFIPVYIPGFVFGPLYLIISAYLDRKGGSNINHSAHIWGALFGVAFLLVAGQLAGFPVMSNFIAGVQDYFNR
ncbi:MAG TPA: rhomboid family intramembrane serine protease [Flavitalea sp.]|nr:rhomboid family intramembrane serine protease [Flavitalea sp.]